ncbi:MAG TPA: GIY-YIG nuclease family protein [Nocardioides sp.]|nr:GIY-YIG nuclease family protein [Nocardioides sp.]
MPWTYLLHCADGTYYVGSTVDLDRRLWQHNHSDLGAAYTRRRRPVTLAWSGWFDRTSAENGVLCRRCRAAAHCSAAPLPTPPAPTPPTVLPRSRAEVSRLVASAPRTSTTGDQGFRGSSPALLAPQPPLAPRPSAGRAGPSSSLSP